jgi:hypothetical protein
MCQKLTVIMRAGRRRGLGLAILGTVPVTQMRSRVTTSLTARGVPAGRRGLPPVDRRAGRARAGLAPTG